MKRLLSADENSLLSRNRPSLSLKRPATHLQKPPQCFGPPTSEEDFQCAHSFEDFVFSGITPLTAHQQSSLLVRGPHHCGKFCVIVFLLSFWIKFCFSSNVHSI